MTPVSEKPVNEELLSCLRSAGAHFDAAGMLAHFDDPAGELHAAQAGDIVCPLDGFGLICAGGADAMNFLQGQLTCDMRLIDEAHSRPGGLCTPKGRLLALPWIFRREEGYLLLLPGSLLQPTLTRLSRYVLRARVTLDASPLALLGVSGPGIPALLEAAGIPVPSAADGVSHDGACTAVRLPGTSPRFVIAAAPATLAALWPQLTARARPVAMPAWDLLDVSAGLPRVLPETLEEFIPQALNLDLLGGIAFDKGCYTGQEIVARVHYRGTVKRRCHLVAGPGDPPAPGTPVYGASGPGGNNAAGNDTGGDGSQAGEQTIGQTVGHVVLAAPDPDGGFLCLASMAQDRATTGGLRLDADRPLTLRELPYLAADAED